MFRPQAKKFNANFHRLAVYSGKKIILKNQTHESKISEKHSAQKMVKPAYLRDGQRFWPRRMAKGQRRIVVKKKGAEAPRVCSNFYFSFMNG